MVYRYFLGFLRPCIESKLFLLAICILAVALKTYFIKVVTSHELKSKKIHKPLLFLLGVLAGSMFGDIAWILKLTRNIFLPNIDYAIVTFFIRIAWGFLVIHYQSLSLFIESLSEKKLKLGTQYKVLLPISCSISLYFFYLAFFETNLTGEFERDIACTLATWPLEMQMMRFIGFYLPFFLTLPSFCIAISRIRYSYLPRILRKQLTLFTTYLMGPYLLIELLQAMQHPVTCIREFLFAIVGISTLLLLISMYICIKKIMVLRFLNYSAHVQTTSHVNLIHDFKGVLEKLSQATTIPELVQTSQHFFHDTFGIPLQKTGLYIRSDARCTTESQVCCNIQNTVERFLHIESPAPFTYLKTYRILIYDEIEFSNFYEENLVRQSLLAFLDSLNAELFIPIFNKDTIIAYFIVENHTRRQEFYGTVERDEMIIFASYVNHIITLLQNKNIDTLMHQEKELQEEVYGKIQQINQYKDAIRSFVRNNKEKKIGIIFYKNRHFIFGNKEAKELIKINLNHQKGHPITKNIKKIVQLVEQYRMPYRNLIKDIKNNNIVLSGVPNLEKNNIIITIYYPEITDLMTNQINSLKDSTKWDYLLYLESTKPGKLINQLIPGDGEQLLNFKICLLKTALGKKATLLEIPEQDLVPTVEVLHHISLREKLHIITINHPEQSNEYTIKLFGLNKIFNPNATTSPALLKKLDNIGTLFIKNIHFLTLDTQKHLAEYIRYGYYRIYKSDHTVICNVRIIVSTDQDLLNLVHNNLFSHDLYNELKKAKLTMPSLNTLPKQELTDLADGITEQTLQSNDTKQVFELTTKEKLKLTGAPPVSIQELRKKIEDILNKKIDPITVYQETQFSGAHISTPELAYAASLGRQALRNDKIMKMLWNKFKNQNKIAIFLGVNRSSVNRRCKKYNLE